MTRLVMDEFLEIEKIYSDRSKGLIRVRKSKIDYIRPILSQYCGVQSYEIIVTGVGLIETQDVKTIQNYLKEEI